MAVKTVTDYERAEEMLSECYSGPHLNESDVLALFEELIRFRDRESLVRAVFTAIVGNADSYYNTEFAPAAIEAMRESIKLSPSAAEADESA